MLINKLHKYLKDRKPHVAHTISKSMDYMRFSIIIFQPYEACLLHQ